MSQADPDVSKANLKETHTGQEEGDICTGEADSLCYTAENNSTVKQLYSNWKKKTKPYNEAVFFWTE